MIIGIDLDDTITDVPEFFGILAGAFVDAGHQVHIITYREVGTTDAVRIQLQELGIRYTHLHIPLTQCTAPEWKGELAAELGLDVMIENSPEVLAKMPPSVQRLWLCDPEIFDLDVCIDAMKK